jgi:hypothetical protein
LREFDPDAIGFVASQGERGGPDPYRDGLAAEWPASYHAQALAHEKAELGQSLSKYSAGYVGRWIDGGDVRGVIYRELAQARWCLVCSFHGRRKVLGIVLQMRITLKTILWNRTPVKVLCSIAQLAP